MTTDCTAIVPFRADDTGERSANLAAVLRWLTSLPVEVVVVHQGPDAGAAPASADGARHVTVVADGPFSKAAACNAGFATVDTPVVALVDADTMVAGGAFLGCVARVRDGVDVIRPFGMLVDLDPATTAEIRRGAAPEQVVAADAPAGRAGESIPVCGGVVVVRSDAYERAGGMDESFAGWGGEDDALSSALIRTGSDCRVLRDERAYHLWHPRGPADRAGHEGYARNATRARWWWEGPDAEIAAAVEAGRRRLAELREG